MYILSFVSQKGGVGKTTSAVNVATCLATHWNKRVLVVDLDPQAAATVCFGYEPDETKNMFQVLLDDFDTRLTDIILETNTPNVMIAPSDIELSGAELYLGGRAGWDRILPLELEPLADQFDFCLIDAPPSMGILSQSALISSDTAIVPLQCEFLSLRALKQLMRIVQRTIQRVKPNIDLLIFRSMYQSGTIQAQEVSDTIEEIAGSRLMQTMIHRATALSNAAKKKQSIFDFAGSSRAASEYRSLTKEILDYVKDK